MTSFHERRKYQRCSSTVCKAVMSADDRGWHEIELRDISAGGLRFVSNSTYEHGQTVKLLLTVYSMLSEFEVYVVGHIVRVEAGSDRRAYAVEFDIINKYDRVQLDEIIKSKVCLENSRQTGAEDGIYDFLFRQRTRQPSFRSKMRMIR